MSVTVTSVTDSYDLLLTTTSRAYQPKMVDNIFRGIPLLYWLEQGKRKRKQNGGHNIAIPLMYGENLTVGLHSGGWETINVTPQEGATMSFWNWKYLVAAITILRSEERKNSGQYKLTDIAKFKTMQAEKSIRWYLNTLLHGMYGSNRNTYCGGDTANTVDSIGGSVVDTTGDKAGYGFNSLDHIVRSGWGLVNNDSASAQSHTVGGITVTNTIASGYGGSYPDWKYASHTLVPTVYVNPWWMNLSNPGYGEVQQGADGGVPGQPLSDAECECAAFATGNTNQNVIGAMRSMYNRLSDGNDAPDLGLTSQTIFETYEGALVPMERFLDTKVGDAGFQNLRYKGMTLMFDKGITSTLTTPTVVLPSAPLYMLNSDYLEWVVDSESDFAMSPWYQPHDQLGRTANIILMAQLTCSNRSKQGVIVFANTTGTYAP